MYHLIIDADRLVTLHSSAAAQHQNRLYDRCCSPNAYCELKRDKWCV